MPIVKLSEFTKPDMKAPKFDINLASLDISTPKSDVHTQELERKSEPLKAEGEITPAGIQKEAVESSFKMPKIKLPSFGPFFSKGAGDQSDVQAGHLDTKITMPSTVAEAEIQLSQTEGEKADIDVDITSSTELEMKGKKSKIKTPKIRMPSFGTSRPRAPEADMAVPDAEGDLSLTKPEAKVEIISGQTAISFDPVKTAESELHIRLPRAELPKLESPSLDVDATLPAVDVTVSKYEVPEGDKQKLPDVHALVKETEKDFRVLQVQMSTEGKEQEPDAAAAAATASSQTSLESKEVKPSGLEGTVTFPKFQMPKFGAFPPKSKGADAAAPIAIVETDLIQSDVTADVEAADVPTEASALDIKAKAPDRESESVGWKMKVPSVKLPTLTKPDTKAPKVDVSLPSVDISIAKTEVQVEKHEAGDKELMVEGEIKPAEIEPGTAESSFKMPKISLPSFGLFSRKGTRSQLETESSESEAEIPGTAVEGDIEVKLPKLESKEAAPGKELGKDILGEPHVEEETSLPEPEEIKALDVRVSTEAKEEQISVAEQPDEISAETTGIEITRPEDKIVFPKFEKPKFAVLLPEATMIDATVIVVKPEADISLPTLTADVEATPTTAEPSVGDVKAKASERESESAEYKIQMPIVKLSEFTKPDMKAPKFDINLASLDISTPKSDVHTQELERKSEPLKAEGEITPAGIQKEAVESSFKMPKIKLPSFGPFFSKGAGDHSDVQAGHLDTKITMPSTVAEAEIQLSQTEGEKADIDVDITSSTELEMKGKKSKIKTPKIRMPSFGTSRPRAPEADMAVPDAEGDLSLTKPEAKVEIISGQTAISFDPVKTAESELHIRLPRAELPKLESPSLDVDATLPAVDVTVSKYEVPEGDKQKLPDVHALVKETEKDFRVLQVQMSTEGKEQEPDAAAAAATASSQTSLESKEVKPSGLEGTVTFPKFQMPKFGAFPPKSKGADAAAPIAIVETDLIQSDVTADVEAADVPTEASALDIKAKAPDRESESVGWKMKVPSVKLPTLTKPDTKAPKVDVSLPSVDISIAKTEVQVEKHEAGDKELMVEGEIKPAEIEPGTAESSFKMPKISLPSFGLFSRKGTRSQLETESSESEAEIPGTAVEGDIEVKLPKLESKEAAPGKELGKDILGEPHVEEETSLPEPEEIKALDVRVSTEAKEEQISVAEQPDEISAETTGIEITRPEDKIVFPKFEKPKFAVLLPEATMIDATVIVVKPEADISLPTLTADVEATPTTAEPSVGDVKAKASERESESAEYKIQMPIVKLSEFTKPDMKAPKFDINLASLDISTPKSDVHTQELERKSEPLKAEGEITPAGIQKEAVESSFKMPKIKLPSFGPFFSKGAGDQSDVQAGHLDTKITMPSTVAEAEIQLSQTEGEKADIDVDITSSTELEMKGKKRKIKTPQIRMPSFGTSRPRAPEADMAVPDAEGDLSLTKPEAKVEIISGQTAISFDPVKTAESELHIRLPRAELPKLESPSLDVDATLPAVDVTVSKYEVPEGDKQKLPDVHALVKETEKDFRVLQVQMSTEGKEQEPDAAAAAAAAVATASSQTSLESKEVKPSGLEGTVTFPKFQMPKFGAFPPKSKGADAAAPIAIVETDLIQSDVTADVEAADVPTEASALDIKAKAPDRESESVGWKMKVPSVKLPTLTKPDTKAPKVDVSLPSVDISIAKTEVQVEKHEAGDKELMVEGEIKPAEIEPGTAESSFKMPKISLPSFGLFSRKGTRSQLETESSESEAEIPGTAVEGDIEVKLPKLESKEAAPVSGIPSSGDLEIKEEKTKTKKFKIKIPTFGKSPPKGKELGKDILGEPHVEEETSLPEPEEIKALDVRVSMEAKEEQISVAEQPDEISAETTGIEITRPEDKIVFPKFEKPKFAVLLPEATMIDATVIVVKPEADISLPTLTADVEATPTTAEPSVGDVKAKASERESESAEYKIQMPIVKLSEFTKPDMKAPKFDINLASLDISTPKSDVHTQELERKSEPLKAEGEITPAGIQKEAVESSFKMPKIKLPSFGPFFSKGAGDHSDVQAGHLDTKITMPSTVAEAEIQLSQTEGEKADIDVDITSSTELEMKGKKSKIKTPKIRMPSFGTSRPRAPEADMAVPDAEGDLSLTKPEAKVEIISGQTAISFDPVKTAESELHIRLPRAELPKLESPSLDVDATLPAVDVTVSKYEVPEGDKQKLPDVHALVKETEKDFRVLQVQMSTEGKEQEPDAAAAAAAATASSQTSLESKEVKPSGLEGTVTFPKFQMPKFVAFPPKSKGADAAAPIAIVETDLIQSNVTADVEAADVPTEASALDIKAKAPDRESESVGWKMKVPSVKLPTLTKPDTKAPKVDVSLPSVDISIAKTEVQVEKHEAGDKELMVEGEIKPAEIEPGTAESSFKMPKISLPSFGLFSRKGTRSQLETESSESEAEIPGTAVEGDIEVKLPKLESKEAAPVSGIPSSGDLEIKEEKTKTKKFKIKIPTFGKSPPKGKELGKDILGEPHVEEETSLPEPEEIKALDVRVSTEAKEEQISVAEQPDEISAETTGIEITRPEDKIVFPKFEKPKFAVLLPEATMIDATVIVVKPEADISLPTLTADVEATPTTAEPSVGDVKAKASERESESAEYKIQMPIVKLSEFTKPDMKAPKFDINLASLDISTPKSDVHTQELERKSEPLKAEGEITPAGIQKEAVESSFKMPKIKLPSFGPFFSKGAGDQSDVQAGHLDTKITMPSTVAEAEIQLSQTEGEKADIDVDITSSTELEMKGKKSKIKTPKIRMPSFGTSRPRAPEADMAVPDAEGDLSLTKPEAKVEIISGQTAISFDPVKTAESELHIRLPRAELPKLESPSLDVDATLPAVDVTVSKYEVPEGDKQKLPDVHALVKETEKDFRVLQVQMSTEGKEQEPDAAAAATASSQTSLESKEVKPSGLEGTVTFPKFQMPKFGAFPPKSKGADAAAPIAIVETDLIQSDVTADVEAADVPTEASALDIKAKAPDRESESVGWKMKVPSVKLPTLTKPDTKAPKVDVSLPSVDISIAKTEVQVEKHEAGDKELMVECEIKPAEIEPGTAESSFKMPKISLPSFGLFSRKGTRSQLETESSESEAEIPGTAVEGDIEVKLPKLESKEAAPVSGIPSSGDLEIKEEKTKTKKFKIKIPTFGKSPPKGKELGKDILGEPHVEEETSLPEPEEIKALDVRVSTEAKEQQISVAEQPDEISAETTGIEITRPEDKIVFPKFEKPKFAVLLPEATMIDATVIVVKPEADISLPTLTADVEATPTTAEPSVGDVKAKASERESESAEYKIQMPIVKLSEFTKPDMKAPKFDINLASLDISTPKSDVHTQELERQSEPLKAEGEITPAGIQKEAVESSFKMPKIKLPSFGPFFSKGAGDHSDVQAGHLDTKITMPSTVAEAEIQLSQTEGEKADIDVDITSSTELEMKGKKSKIKTPKIRMPSFGTSRPRAPEADMAVPDAEGDLSLTKPEAKVEIISGQTAISFDPVKTAESELHIRLPRAELPKLESPSLDVDATLPAVDVTVSKYEVPEGDKKKLPDVHALVKETEKDFRVLQVQMSTEGKEQEPDAAAAATASSQTSLESKEVKPSGLEGTVTFPKFQMPKFGAFPPKSKGADAAAPIAIVETDLIQSDVTADVEAADVPTEASALDIKAKAPDRESESVGWKMKVPSVKLPTLTKPDTKAPKVDVSLPSVDISIAKTEVQVEKHEAGDKELMVEGEIKPAEIEPGTAESSFKMPKISLPSFGLFSRKGTRSQLETESSESEAEIPGTAVEGDIEVKLPKLESKEAAPVSGIPSSGDLEIKEEKSKTKKFKIKIPTFGKSPPKGKELGKDILGEPHVEEETSLPEPEEIKALDVRVSTEAKEEQISVAEQPDEISAETTGIEITRPEDKIVFPKFEKPKFAVLLPEATMIDATVIVVKPEADISLPTLTADVEATPTTAEPSVGDVKAKASERESESAEYKIQMPIVKLSEFTKPDMKAPKFDINLASLDISTPKSDVHTQELERQSEPLKAEGEITPAGIQKEAVESSFKMPKIKLPSFGPFFSKGAGDHSDVQAGHLDTKITMPSTVAEAEIQLSQTEGEKADIDVDITSSTELEMKGKKSKIKTPKIRMPSFGTSRPRAPEADMAVPDAEGDLSLTKPEAKVEIISGQTAISFDPVKTAESELHIRLPRAELPKLESPSLDVDATLPAVDVTVSKYEVPEGDKQKLPDVHALVKETEKDFRVLQVQMSTEGKEQEPDAAAAAATASSQTSLESKEVKPSGLEGTVTFPKFQMPKFGAFPPKSKGADAAAPIAIVETDLIQSDVTADVEAADVPTEASALDIKAKAPDRESESVGWKMKVPSVKLPTLTKPDTKAPKVDVSLPSVDISIAKTEVQVEKHEAGGKELMVEGEIKPAEIEPGTAESSFKMPKISLPSFGLFSRKGTRSQLETESSESEAEIPGTAVEGDIEIKLPKLESKEAAPVSGIPSSGDLEIKEEKTKTKKFKIKIPTFGKSPPKGKELGKDILGEPHVEEETSLPEPEKIKALDVRVSTEAKEQQISVAEQPDEISAETTGIEITRPEDKIVFPKFEKPKFAVLLPEATMIDATVIVVKPEADISPPTLTADVEATPTTAEPSVGDVKAKASERESESAEYKIQMPIVKLSEITKPDMKAAKFDINLASLDISTPKPDVHTQELERQSEPLKAEGEITPAGIQKEAVESSFKMPKIKLPSFGPFFSKGAGDQSDVQAGHLDTKITMPSTVAEAEIQLSQTEGEKADIDVDITSSTELEMKGKKSKIKTPKIRMPSFGTSRPRAPEADMAVPDAEGDLSLTKPEAKVEIISGQTAISFDPVKTAESELHIRLPRAELPKLESPSLDVDATLPAVDVTVSKYEVPEGDKQKLPDVHALVKETEKDFRVLQVQMSTEGKEQEPDAAAAPASSQMSLESKEVKPSGLEGTVTFPKFQMPKFGAFPPKSKGADAAAPIAIVETDLIQSDVTADVEAADVPTEASALDIKAKAPDRESESVGWKMKVPSVKLPTLTKPDTKAPKVDVSLPSVDISIAKTEVQVEKHEAGDKELMVEGEIKPAEIEPGTAESSFKMPKISLPSFGLFSRKGTRSQLETESSESEAEIPGTAVEGDIEVKLPKLESKEAAPVSGIPSSGDLEIKEEKSKTKKFKIKIPTFGKSPPKGKELGKDILGEPHVEEETSLPEPEEIKALDVRVSTEAKEEQISVAEQPDEISAETTGIEITRPEDKIVFPKFQKPKFAVLLPEATMIDATVIVVKPEADISLPTLTADVEATSTTAEPSVSDVKAKASERESESAEYKIQMPIVKLSEFTKPDMKAPKFDINLASLDISTPKSDVHTQELERQSEPLKAEGEITPAGIQKEAVESSFKMPKIKLPSFGPFFSKGAGDQSDVQAGHLDTKITMPSTVAEAEIQLSQTEGEKADIDVDITSSTELEMKVKKSKIKTPKIRMPSFGTSRPRAPEADMAVPDAEGDLSLTKPEAKVEIISGQTAISFDPVKTAESELHIRLPRAELPKLESPSLDVDATLPAVDVTVSKYEVPEGDKKKLPDVHALVKETEKDFRVLQVQMSTEGKEQDPDAAAAAAAATASSQTSLESKQVKPSGLEGTVTFPKFQMPKFGAFPPKSKGADAAAPIAIVETDLIQSDVTADVEAADVPTEASALDIKAKAPDRESESVGWKMKVPSVKLPTLTKPDTKAPKVDVSLPSVDISIAKTEVQVEKHEAGDKELMVECEIKPAEIEPGTAESSFKMPKISLPSFGLFSRKGTRSQLETESSESEAEIPGTAVEGDIEVKLPKLESKEAAPVSGIPSSGDLEIKEEKSKPKKFKIKIPTFGKSPPKGKELGKDILVEPHVEEETLPEPEEIKVLDRDEATLYNENKVETDSSSEVYRVQGDVPVGVVKISKGKYIKFMVASPEDRKDTLFSRTITPHGTYSSRCEYEVSDLLVHSCESKLKSKVKMNLQEQEPFSHAAEMHKECPETDEIPAETYSIETVQKAQILSETKTPKFGFSLLKVKISEPYTNVDIAIEQVSDKKDTSEGPEDEHQPSITDENVRTALQKTDTCSNELMEETTVSAADSSKKMSSNVSIPKLKMFTFEVKSSTDDTNNCQSLEQNQSIVSASSVLAAQPDTEGNLLQDQTDKHGSSKSPGRFKLWLPKVGFSSSADDTNPEFNAGIQKSIPEEAQPAETSDPDLTKPKEKTGWFRLPKISFSSPLKKEKTADQEEVKKQAERNKAAPNESTSTKEEAVKGGESVKKDEPKTSSDIVRSSARTELIWLENEEEDISDSDPKPANK
ncbi:LOW QUALITY PROTEIN: neuroblast differentiation-associated protein AHNAK-like [Microcaecilia unicolor]|uniref:LOW QUALITY PROTEIN: neuroblast differentiation-associated protein AHNAK-like n=1 Tax=Microcaecilia unicolor TaxID=1415580 RepID=A0A6P7Z1C1_9AMPH|nr:LOW QUALITY PROTEIN: neuroblast differentiation-associated protein AHNAK-like [Microcaecilia unicolor]